MISSRRKTARSVAGALGGSHAPAIVGGRAEDLLAQLFGRDVGDDFELGSIFEDLGEPPINLSGLAPTAEELVDLAFDLAARHPGALAEEEEQALGRFQPALIRAVEIKRNHPLLRRSGPDQVAGEHDASQSPS